MQANLRQHIEKLITLTDDEFAFVRSCFTTKHAGKNEYLIKKGDGVRHMYFVISGLLKLVYTDDSAREHIVSFAMEDWWETDYLAFYTQVRATLSLQCLEDTEVLCLSLEDYNKLCADLPRIEHFLLKKAIAGHIASQQRILSFLTSNAKERYDQLLQRHPSLLQRVPKTLLASYLGVSRETLSRLSA
jgi:CRP-like cAMP-binding protein